MPGPAVEPVWTDKKPGTPVSVAVAAEALASLAPPETGPVADAENAIEMPVGVDIVSDVEEADEGA
jgi:hypothetical protein